MRMVMIMVMGVVMVVIMFFIGVKGECVQKRLLYSGSLCKNLSSR